MSFDAHRGTNQPNVFFDLKSSEYFPLARGWRNDDARLGASCDAQRSDAIDALQLTSPTTSCFVDGSPGSLLVTEDAVPASMLVVIPQGASKLDLAASRLGTPIMRFDSPVWAQLHGKQKQG